MKTHKSKVNVIKRQLARQEGVSLVVSMIFILILAFLGLAAMRNSTLQERMANNMRDRNIALQAAELALRDAERDLASYKSDGVTFCQAGTTGCRPLGERPVASNLRGKFWAYTPTMRLYWTDTCNHGQCFDIVGATKPVWDSSVADWTEAQTGNTLKTVKYGTYTGATPITSVLTQPRYIIEAFTVAVDDPYGVKGSTHMTFRITARAVGQNPNTVVILQSVSSPN
jgi:type IV pilus assembly protein PilX